ncbi:MAG TPA: glycosyltransferase family 39 protein [Pirellulales bacterium]|nr:glycosyltransferase family 39 protein [Pirellulales bacterium]
MNPSETRPAANEIISFTVGEAGNVRHHASGEAPPPRPAVPKFNWRLERPLGWILLAGLLLRLALFGAVWLHSPDLSATHYPDSSGYLDPAASLVAHGEFSRGGVPELLRTPGYPLLLAIGTALGHVELVTVLLQTLLSLVTIAAVYYIALSLTGNRRAAIVAAGLFAIEPLSLIYTSYLMAETLFGCLVALMVAALVRYGRSDSFIPLVLGAALLAAATLVRPISYFLPPLVALALLGRGILRAETRQRAMIAALLFLVVSHGPAVAWRTRNWLVAGYNGYSAVSALNMYYFQGASVVAALKHESLEEAQREFGGFSVDFIPERFYELHPELRSASQAEIYRFMQRAGSKLVRENPLVYAKVHLRGLTTLLLNPGAPDLLALLRRLPNSLIREHRVESGLWDIVVQMHRQTPSILYTNLVLAGVLGLIYLAATVGCLGFVRRPNWQLVPVLLVAGYLLAIAGGPTCIARLRAPAMPLACVLSGVGVAELLRLRKGRSSNDSRNNDPRQQPDEADFAAWAAEVATMRRATAAAPVAAIPGKFDSSEQFS